jgi:DnaJ-class molecular chaperone
LDFGTKSAFDAIELNDQYLKILAQFNNEVVSFLEYLKQEFFYFFENESKQTTDDLNSGNYQSEIDLAYQTLGLDLQASNDEVKKSYRKLAKKYHPDHNHDESAKAEMLKINAAYALIKKERNF